MTFFIVGSYEMKVIKYFSHFFLSTLSKSLFTVDIQTL